MEFSLFLRLLICFYQHVLNAFHFTQGVTVCYSYQVYIQIDMGFTSGNLFKLIHVPFWCLHHPSAIHYFLAQKVLVLLCIFLAPVLERAISSRSPGSFNGKQYQQSKISFQSVAASRTSECLYQWLYVCTHIHLYLFNPLSTCLLIYLSITGQFRPVQQYKWLAFPFY